MDTAPQALQRGSFVRLSFGLLLLCCQVLSILLWPAFWHGLFSFWALANMTLDTHGQPNLRVRM